MRARMSALVPRTAWSAGDRFLLATIVAMLASRVWFVFHRAFDPDEFEHMHAAWNIAQGMIPYRDFFEHHTPWMHFMLAPLTARFATASDPSSGAAALVAGRFVMWLAAGIPVAVVVQAGTLWHSRSRGLLAGAFVATSALFLDLGLEIRPDGPALACIAATIFALMRASKDEGAQWKWLIVAGGSTGAAVMFVQKYLLVAPAIAIAAATIESGAPRAWRRRLSRAALVTAAAALPVAVTVGWF